jgi:putative transposase
MAGTFSQMYVHIVFAVKFRQSLINESWEEDLYKYISGILKNKEQKMLVINGMPDHIHFIIGMKPSCCLSDLVREIKKSSNEFINEKKFCNVKFQWQEGFGAFTYCDSTLNNAIRYIQNQKEHHRIQTFKDEYFEFLRRYNIEFKEDFLFNWL